MSRTSSLLGKGGPGVVLRFKMPLGLSLDFSLARSPGFWFNISTSSIRSRANLQAKSVKQILSKRLSFKRREAELEALRFFQPRSSSPPRARRANEIGLEVGAGLEGLWGRLGRLGGYLTYFIFHTGVL